MSNISIDSDEIVLPLYEDVYTNFPINMLKVTIPNNTYRVKGKIKEHCFLSFSIISYLSSGRNT